MFRPCVTVVLHLFVGACLSRCYPLWTVSPKPSLTHSKIKVQNTFISSQKAPTLVRNGSIYIFLSKECNLLYGIFSQKRGG